MKKYQVPTLEIIKTMPMLLSEGSPTLGGGGIWTPPSTEGEGNAAPWRY